MSAVMDVVVPCDCGTRFSFSVEPVNGRLPEGAELLCPKCGKDGVPLANRVIGDDLRKVQREQERKAQENGAQQPRKGGSWLKREKKPEPAKAPADPYSTNYVVSSYDPYAQAQAKGDDSVYAGPNKVKGMAGAVLGGLIGAAAWAATVYFTGYEIRYVAVGVGVLAGLGSRVIGGGRDYHLGLFASACALMAILLGQFFAAKIYMETTFAGDMARFEYDMKFADAKRAETLTTDEDFKDFIAASTSTLYKPRFDLEITAKEIADFKVKELPALKKFAAGEPSREAFIQQERKSFLEKQTVKDIFHFSITPYLFFWVFVGVGAAWKLASDYGTSVE